MSHPIDPKIDCVFNALLGAEGNRNLLLHFLNAFLAGEIAEPLVWVDILNPHDGKGGGGEGLGLGLIDVLAKDGQGKPYQVEIQLARQVPMNKLLFDWSFLFGKQPLDGRHAKPKPTYSIWLLTENMFAGDGKYAHHFKMRDDKGNAFIEEHGGILLFELDKFHADKIETEKQRWLQFFKDGGRLDNAAPPDWMASQEMQQALKALSLVSGQEG